jgi:ABC-type glycerol-3-phosphate transport system substrate-binding protein
MNNRTVMSRRALIKFAAVLGGGMALTAACGPSAPAAPTPAAVSPTAAAPAAGAAAATTAPGTAALSPAQLSFTHYRLTDPVSGPALEASLKAFEQANPGVTIERQPIAFNDITTKVLIAMQGGSPADVSWVPDSFAGSLRAQGFLLQLNDLADKYNANQIFDVPPAVRSALQDSGKDYFVPITTNVYGFLIHTGAWQQVGLDPDKPAATWDDLKAAATKLTQPDKQTYGYSAGAAGTPAAHGVLQWLYSGGGEMFSADRKEIAINSQGAADALDFWAGLMNTYGPPGVITLPPTSNSDSFVQGRLGIFETACTGIFAMQKTAPDSSKFMKLVAPPDPWKPPAWVDGYILAAASKYPDHAFRLIQHLASDQQLVPYIQAAGSPPSRLSVATLPGIKELPWIPTFEGWIKDKAVSVNPELHPKWAQLEPMFINAFQSVIAKSATGKQALDKFAADGSKVLNS